jgi:hypothetical protein
MASYEDVVHKDLQLMWVILEAVSGVPWLDDFLRRVISKHPWQDICAVPWLCFVYGCYEYRSKHFLACDG